MIATEDSRYESASDYDEEPLALITSEEHAGDDLIMRRNTWLLKMLIGMKV